MEVLHSYVTKLTDMLGSDTIKNDVPMLANALYGSWLNSGSIYICGNGGSAGNAVHMANDLIYGAGVNSGGGLRVEALSANTAVLTCLANDTGYENIFSEQLKIKGDHGDLLIALSGSGNSSNIIRAIETANEIGMRTFAILGYSGGRCKDIVDHAIHFEVDDMQIAEDLQMIVAHICMQWLSIQKVS